MLTRPNVCTLDFIIRNQINLETEANFEHKTILLNFFHPAWVLPFPYFYLVNSRARQTNITHSHLCIFHLKPTSHPHTDAGAPHEIVFYANNMFDGFFLFFKSSICTGSHINRWYCEWNGRVIIHIHIFITMLGDVRWWCYMRSKCSLIRLNYENLDFGVFIF